MNLQYKTKPKPLKSAQNLFIGRKTICNSAEGQCLSIYLMQESDYPSAPLWWFRHGFSQYCVYQCFTLYYCRGASCGWLSASPKLTWWWSGQHHTGSCVIYEKSVPRDVGTPMVVRPWGVEPQSLEPESSILSIELWAQNYCLRVQS